jgi:hypothetical protein
MNLHLEEQLRRSGIDRLPYQMAAAIGYEMANHANPAV